MKKLLWLLFGLLWLVQDNLIGQKLKKGEYFFNTDPGFGLGNTLSFTSTDTLSAPFTIQVPNSLSAGVNRLYVRMQDESDRWSLPEVALLIIGHQNKLISKGEYFIDQDPGFGKAIPLNFPSSANLQGQFVINLPASLSHGVHALFVRVADETGTWGLAESFLFIISNQQKQLVAAEYFFDTDPGFGMAVPLSFDLTDTANIQQNISIPQSLTNGVHRLYLRSKNEGGTWGLAEFFEFTVDGSLPITLLDFKATLVNGDGLVQWQVADNNEVKYFDLQYSTDGRNFNKVSTFPKGETAEYSFRHTKLAPGNHFYRLLMVDKDGKKELSNTMLLQIQNNQTLITGLLQNPIQGNRIMVGIKSANVQSGNARLFDMSGRLVMQQNIKLFGGYNQVALEEKFLPKGIYHLYISTTDGTHTVLPLMKN